MLEEAQPLDPEQIKNLFKNKPTTKQAHTDYDYNQTESFTSEINEFISYSEVKSELDIYQTEYNHCFSSWKNLTLKEKKACIQECCNGLDMSIDYKRISAAKNLVYIALGNYGEFKGQENHEQHLQVIMTNNRLLYEMDILLVLKQALSHACKQIESPTISSSNESLEAYCQEIDMYLTILYLVIEANRRNPPISIAEYYIAEFLFDLVVRLKEHFTRNFPLKKLMLNIWKVLHVTFGDLTTDYEALKHSVREASGLPMNDKSTLIKCTPEDLYTFYTQSTGRYPTFTQPEPPKEIKNALTVSASSQLASSMGLSKASTNLDLPYQTLFPSKSQQQQQINKNNNNANGSKQQQQQQQQQNEAQVLPFTSSGPFVPFSLSEASAIWMNHLFISLSNYQIIHEREKAIHRWELYQKKKEVDDGDDIMNEWNILVFDKLDKKSREKIDQIEHLYSAIVPHFQSIVVVILKLLLSTVSIGKDSKNSEIVEDVNITRNRETISKSVSAVLLLLLKWFKVAHTLKFEYLSQVLIDSGCMLLILKLLGLQEVALLASRKTDDESQSFFAFVKEGKSKEKEKEKQQQANGDDEGDNNTKNNNGEEEEDEEEEDEEGDNDDGDNEDEDEKHYTNKRNLFWSINLLRILQMLTKRKTHRILLLVQYKSSAILKRLLKVGHPLMDYYVLKNLKNQVPFMGRKWRASNMKTISAIYSHCFTSLSDDWLSSSESNADMDEAAMKETNLRMLIRLYNGQRYVSSLLPVMDDMTGPDSTTTFYNDSNNPTEMPEYKLNEPILINDIELDSKFKNHYQDWLEKEVYSTTDEESTTIEEEEDDNKSWQIGTPIPDALPVPLSNEELAREINKLYQEELEREFHAKMIKKKKKEELVARVDGWGDSIVQNGGDNGWNDAGGNGWNDPVNTNGWNHASSSSSTNDWLSQEEEEDELKQKDKELLQEPLSDDEDADDVEPEADPLQGINWETLSEEDLMKRLAIVEEKTSRRWLNVDMDDPRYLKVLNTFEGEVIEDEEGWAVDYIG